MNRLLFCVAGALFLLGSCQNANYRKVTNDPALYRKTVKKLNDIVLENNFPPVIASRNYAYANIAANEIVEAGDPDHFQLLAGQIKHLPQTPKPPKGAEIDFPFASMLALCTVGNAVTFPEGSMTEYVEQLKKQAEDAGMPSKVFGNSVSYADTVAKHIMKWSKGDNYLQTRSASKYTVKTEDGRWIPTPPMYAQALEPHWMEIRAFVLDSASQIPVPAPPPYNMKDKNSAFCKGAMEVMEIGDNLSPEQKHIADFWDDNPLKLNVSGHVMFTTKKFSPPGHWMGIVGIAAQKAQADFATTVYAYAITAIAKVDAFIQCWDEKYRSNYVRPETVINKYIDPEWRPFLQTPPFPEYTCGHSTTSAAAAEALTKVFGDNFEYTDTTELEFGIPNRSFSSFRQAADENNWARFYGRIHFYPFCGRDIRKGHLFFNILNDIQFIDRVDPCRFHN